MHDELVRPEMGGGEAEAAFGIFDPGNSFCVFGRGEMGILDRRQASRYHAVVRTFSLVGECFIEEDVEGPGQSEVTVNMFFLDKLLDCLNMSNFVVGYLGRCFNAVSLDVIRHAEVDFWSQVTALSLILISCSLPAEYDRTYRSSP